LTVQPPQRIALVVHPARPIAEPLAALRRWADERGVPVVELHALGSVDRDVAPDGVVEPGDLIVALGGDGTVLSALRTSARLDAPVLGVACGSLGVLTTVAAGNVVAALERVRSGDWTPRRLPALAIHAKSGPDQWAVNDFVAVRRGAGQLIAAVSVDDQLYVRLAGDGLIVSTAFGSSGYSMAAGGPLLGAGMAAFVVTPLAMHGGSAPPLVVPATSALQVELRPGFAGFDVEIDGHSQPGAELEYTLTLRNDKVTLVSFDADSHMLTRLRDRRLISDSPRVLARDDRTAAEEK
jgi:NAD+ kinase